MSTTKQKIALPESNSDTKTYWDSAAQGVLLIKRCKSCDQTYFYPRPLCPFCMSDDTEWLKTAGKGTVYSYTFAKRGPNFQIPALITLDEGPAMMSAIVNCELADVNIGQRVKVSFVETEGGGALPVFSPE
ncbi:MAG: zinc ribbon domain-containing protein [Spongiibacteraceae bacterium]